MQDQAPEPGNNICYEDLITFVEDRPGHDARYAIDSSKIQNELGWSPRESFEAGLSRTVAWYLDHESWWQPVLDGSYRLERRGMDEDGS
jgi:dTDP-glucose 4,6-dehydratase